MGIRRRPVLVFTAAESFRAGTELDVALYSYDRLERRLQHPVAATMKRRENLAREG